MTPTVSVTMTVFNAAPYLAAAIESILAQTFGDFEFVIIDDGSTDGSGAILERYAQGDTRIRLVRRENRGIAISRNEALALARGEFLAVMDADDISLPERLQSQVEFLRSHPEIVCVGGEVMLMDFAGRNLFPGHKEMDHDEIQAIALSGLCPLNNPSVMMRTATVREVGGYRPDFDLAEDLDLFLRLGEKGKLKNLPGIIHKYRIHDQSVSERKHHRYLDRSRVAVEEACARRGLPSRFVAHPPWRPTDRTSRVEAYLRYGWLGFLRGDRRMAREYGAKAVRLMPWRLGCWRLLLCSAFKRLPPAGLAGQ